MNRNARVIVVVLAGLAAAPALDPDDATRRGNLAFARGEFAAALDWYTRAEERTTDPGLIAFNKAAALYRLDRFREAELHYRRCREDAVGPRLPRLLLGLGNSLLQQSQGRSPALIQEAVGCYERCLARAETDADLVADARHNLELARQLLEHAQNLPEGAKPPDREAEVEVESPYDKRSARQGHRDDPALAKLEPKPGSRPRPGERGDPGASPQGVDQPPPPGKGNLPPLPDEDELTALSPEDAAEHLRRAALRIACEQLEHRRLAAPTPSRTVLDW